MEIIRTFTVAAPIEKVWDVLGNDYGGACKWGAGLYHSEGRDAPTLDGADFDKRYCETNVGNVTETIRVFDPRNHILEYEVIDGFPGFVESGVNTWSLRNLGDGTTEVNVHFVAVLTGLLGTLMKPVMRWQLGRTFDRVLSDFRVYVETGRPSVNKAREMAQRAKKSRRAA